MPLDQARSIHSVFMGFPAGSGGKESACNTGDLGSIPGLGRSPGEGNSMDRGAWRVAVHVIAELGMIDQLSTARHSLWTHIFPLYT